MKHVINHTINHLRKFTNSVLHGDQEHRDWLVNEVEKYIKENFNEN